MANLRYIIDMQAVRKTRCIGGNLVPSRDNNIRIQTYANKTFPIQYTKKETDYRNLQK